MPSYKYQPKCVVGCITKTLGYYILKLLMGRDQYLFPFSCKAITCKSRYGVDFYFSFTSKIYLIFYTQSNVHN